MDLTDELGVPVREQGFDVCAEARFEDDEVVSLGCTATFADLDGAAEATFSTTDGRALQDVTVTASLDGTALEGSVSSVRQGPVQLPESFVDVDVDAAFTAPRALLPELVTRFRLVGSVFGGRKEGIPDASGTLFVDVSFDGGETVEFTGSGPVTTNASGVYNASVDVGSNFFFAVSKDTITARIDIDGFQGEGVDLSLAGEKGRDPRIVDGFVSF